MNLPQALVLKFTDAILWNGGNKINGGDGKAQYVPHSYKKGNIADYHYRHYSYPFGTICYHSVNNMLHVLCGERPYSTLWYESYTGLKPQYVSEIEEATKNSYIRIETPTALRYDIKTGTLAEQYVDEIYATRKPAEDTWMQSTYTLDVGSVKRSVMGAYPTWEVMYQFLGHETFGRLISTVEEIIGKPWHEITFDRFLAQHGADSRLIALLNDFDAEALGTTPLYMLINGHPPKLNSEGKYPEYTPKFGLQNPKAGVPMTYLRLNTKGIEQGVPHRGTIIVPVTDTILKKIANGPGCATIFDGGVVKIMRCQPFSNMLISEFQGVQIGMPETDEAIYKERIAKAQAERAAKRGEA